jgi:hypothetical protein
VFPCELKRVFPVPSDICISKISSLIIKGQVTVNSLVLDGSLRLHANEGSSLFCTFHLSNPVTNFGTQEWFIVFPPYVFRFITLIRLNAVQAIQSISSTRLTFPRIQR